jgi:signal transduction histidine kinase
VEGLDREWVEAGTRRTAYYSHLPPGDYLFRVTAANSDGVWNGEGQSLAVIVLPPFYRTWWFLTLSAIGVTGLVLLGYRSRIAQLKRAQAAQQAFSRRLIESQESERQRIAAELHDSLGQSLLIIKNRAFLASSSLDDKEEAKEQLDEISSSATQAIEEAREIAYNLRPFQLDRFGLTRTLEAIFIKSSDTSGIQFSAEVEPIDGLCSKETEIGIYRIVQESVNNILKHSRATEAKLWIERNGREVQIRIEDNGQGFSVAERPTGEASAARTGHSQSANGNLPSGGFGLIGMAERARMLGGVYTIDSGPGQGTVITVKLTVAG